MSKLDVFETEADRRIAELQAENDRLNQVAIDLSNKRDAERLHCDDLGIENTKLKSELEEARLFIKGQKRRLKF